MKNAKKILALFLAAVMILMASAVPALAASKVDPSASTAEKLESYLYRILDKLVEMMNENPNITIELADPGAELDEQMAYGKELHPAVFLRRRIHL